MALTASVFFSTRMRATVGDALPQHASDLAARRIGRMQHAAHAVRAFGCERRLAVSVAIEPRAPLDQLARIARSLVAEHAHGALVAEPVARDHRVARVEFRRVVFADRRGDAALRVLGVAFVRIGFRDDDDVAGRRQLDRRAEPRDSAADDDEVAAYIHRAYTNARPRWARRLYYCHMLRVDVQTGSQSYPIYIEHGLTAQLGRLIESSTKASRQFFVSSPLVWKFHGRAMAKAVPKTETILLPDGEKYKQLATASRAYESLIKLEADRGAGIIAVGGGVIGDMAGFVAATYLRGIRLVQVPTTLLAQVDSAIGGKVGVNHPLGKNLIGAFHQPSLVAIDPALLETLPRREFRAGLYEVIKYGMTSSRDLFDRIDRELDAIFARKPDALVPIIGESCTHQGRPSSDSTSASRAHGAC